jgi:hypothetical protein
MRRITAGFRGKHAQTSDFMHFAEALPALESLSLLFLDGWTPDVHKYWQDIRNAVLPLHRHVLAREVLLAGCMPESFGFALPNLFDLSRVTKLALLSCKSEILRTLSNTFELKNLTHFELRNSDCFNDSVSEHLRAIFSRNASLQHLCLHVYELSTVSLVPEVIIQADQPSNPSYTTPYIWPLRPMLKTLSLYDPSYLPYLQDLPYPEPAELQLICSQFSALEQLGLWLHNNRIPAQEVEARDEETMSHLVSAVCCPILS